MRYVSIDIETLGLDPTCCDIVEFGAVIDDLESDSKERWNKAQSVTFSLNPVDII